MLTGLFMVAVIAGSALFWAKWLITTLILSIFPAGVKRWIYRTPLAMVAMDFIFGAMASPVIAIAGGTIAMLTLITFTAWSALFISVHILAHKTRCVFSRYSMSWGTLW